MISLGAAISEDQEREAALPAQERDLCNGNP